MGKFLLLIGLLISTFGFACKCDYRSFGENFANNDFVAEIEILKVYNFGSNTDEDDRFYKADIKILKLYKGETISSILIRGKIEKIYRSACEIAVSKGEKFLVYLNPNENFGMSSCTPKINLDNENITKERNAIEFLINHKITNTNCYYFSDDYFKKFKNLSPKNDFAVYKLKVNSKSKVESISVIQDFETSQDAEIKKVVKNKFTILKDFMTEVKNEEVVLVLFFDKENENVISNFSYLPNYH